MTEPVIAPTGEEPVVPAGEEPVVPPTRVPDEYEPAVLKRIQAAVARGQKEERDKIARETEQSKMSDTEKANARAIAAENRLQILEAKNAELDRRAKVQDAAHRIGFVPPVYIKDALDSCGDEEFDAAVLAQKAREAYLEDVKRENPNGTTRQTARTGGALHGGGDLKPMTPEQAIAHAKTLKPSERIPFYEKYGKELGIFT